MGTPHTVNIQMSVKTLPPPHPPPPELRLRAVTNVFQSMVCSLFPTPRPILRLIKNDFCRIALRFHTAQKQAPTQIPTRFCTHFIGLYLVAYLHCRIWMLIPIRTGNQMATERFTLHGAMAMPAVVKRSA